MLCRKENDAKHFRITFYSLDENVARGIPKFSPIPLVPCCEFGLGALGRRGLDGRCFDACRRNRGSGGNRRNCGRSGSGWCGARPGDRCRGSGRRGRSRARTLRNSGALCRGRVHFCFRAEERENEHRDENANGQRNSQAEKPREPLLLDQLRDWRRRWHELRVAKPFVSRFLRLRCGT